MSIVSDVEMARNEVCRIPCISFSCLFFFFFFFFFKKKKKKKKKKTRAVGFLTFDRFSMDPSQKVSLPARFLLFIAEAEETQLPVPITYGMKKMPLNGPLKIPWQSKLT